MLSVVWFELVLQCHHSVCIVAKCTMQRIGWHPWFFGSLNRNRLLRGMMPWRNATCKDAWHNTFWAWGQWLDAMVF
jgi:hypothetical protein